MSWLVTKVQRACPCLTLCRRLRENLVKFSWKHFDSHRTIATGRTLALMKMTLDLLAFASGCVRDNSALGPAISTSYLFRRVSNFPAALPRRHDA
jgi:hypothetical protein